MDNSPFHNPVLSIFGDSFVEGTMLLINGIDRKISLEFDAYFCIGKRTMFDRW